MLIVIAVAAGAALSVLVYNRVRERDPELASASAHRNQPSTQRLTIGCV